MTNVQLLSLKKDTQTFLEKSSMEVLGAKAGVGKLVIDNLLAENFTAIEDRHIKMIQRVVKKEFTNGLYRTSDCLAFMDAAADAVKYKLMIGITGDTGAGKSYMSTAIAKKENVYYYNVHLKKSPRIFFQDLLQNMNIPFSGNMSELIDKVSKQLNTMEKPLLILDEFDKAHKDIRAAVHTLRDRTMENCGLLLVGMPALKNDLMRGKDAGKPGYAEFARRVNIWHHLEGLRPDEIKKVLHDSGITDAELVREYKQYKSFGELVNAINLYKRLND